MKPSERIEEIYKTKGTLSTDNQDYINQQIKNYLNSIIEYLDESTAPLSDNHKEV